MFKRAACMAKHYTLDHMVEAFETATKAQLMRLESWVHNQN